MSSMQPGTRSSLSARPVRDAVPRRLIVTASVVAFAVRDWSLWALLRVGPWGPPMRLVLGRESVAEAVARTLDALLCWADSATLVQLRSGWQEQQVQVWGSSEQGSSVSLIHSILLRAQRDMLRPNLHLQPIPSLHVQWVPVAEIESGQQMMDPEIQPSFLSALQSLRAHIQQEPEILLRYLADMHTMSPAEPDQDWWQQEERPRSTKSRETMPLQKMKEPATGDGTLTLAEASLLYRAFFPANESIDMQGLRRRFLATKKLIPTDEERLVRGREKSSPRSNRASKVYRYEPDGQ
ncbi:hypothetical protein [Dictyobacter halimunensis]